jgi:hypothetical protein
MQQSSREIVFWRNLFHPGQVSNFHPIFINFRYKTQLPFYGYVNTTRHNHQTSKTNTFEAHKNVNSQYCKSHFQHLQCPLHASDCFRRLLPEIVINQLLRQFLHVHGPTYCYSTWMLLASNLNLIWRLECIVLPSIEELLDLLEDSQTSQSAQSCQQKTVVCPIWPETRISVLAWASSNLADREILRTSLTLNSTVFWDITRVVCWKTTDF